MEFIQRNSYFVIICLLCAGAALIGAVQSINEEEHVEIVISEGDTLWDLSERFADVKIPKDRWIAQVMKMNDLPTTMIREGDTLILPEQEVLKHDKNHYEMAGIGQ